MNESTTYAPGELDLLAFAEAWAVYCEEHGLVWPAPKVAIEDGAAIARFQEQRVSVRPLSGCKRLQPAFAWCASEAESRWCPVVWCEEDAREFCARLAKVLDRRIPW